MMPEQNSLTCPKCYRVMKLDFDGIFRCVCESADWKEPTPPQPNSLRDKINDIVDMARSNSLCDISNAKAASEILKVIGSEILNDLQSVDGSNVLDIHIKRLTCKWQKLTEGGK